MKILMSVIALCAVLLWSRPAHAIEGFSGSTWGTLLYNFNGDGLQTLGNLNQGIDWFEFNGFLVTTFAEMRWRGQQYKGHDFNAWGPAIGVSVKRWGLRMGAEYYWEREANDTNTDDRAMLFVDWYYSWDLKKLLP